MRIRGKIKEHNTLMLVSAALIFSMGILTFSYMPTQAASKDIKVTAESTQSSYNPSKRTKEDEIAKLKSSASNKSASASTASSSTGSSGSTAKKDVTKEIASTASTVNASTAPSATATVATAATTTATSASSNSTKASTTTQTATPTTTVVDNDHVWIRANLSYRLDSELYGIDDNAVTFSDTSKWVKQGDWYYYKEPVESGQKLRFINGFSIPTSWSNSTRDKKFEIVATVQAAEAIPGETSWNSNSEVAYSQTFDVWKAGNTSIPSNETINQSSIKLIINEYQLDKNGKEVSYENDKLVTPGQKISKIIEIEVQGKKGKQSFSNFISRVTGDDSLIPMYMLGTVVALAAILASVAALRKQKKGGK